MKFLSEFRRDLSELISGLRKCFNVFFTKSEDLKEIKRLLIIMATRQEEFDLRIAKASELVARLVTAVDNMRTAVEEETEEIRRFIDSLPENVDTSALDGVISNLEDAVVDADVVDEEVSGIFTPEPVEEEVEEETEEPTPPAPVEEEVENEEEVNS